MRMEGVMSVMQYEMDAATRKLREMINATGYGGWIKDDQVASFTYAALEAASQARAAHVVTNAVPAPPPHAPLPKPQGAPPPGAQA
jgi:hypothetical protein